MDGLEVDEGFAVPKVFDVDPETCHCTTPPRPSNPKHPKHPRGQHRLLGDGELHKDRTPRAAT